MIEYAKRLSDFPGLPRTRLSRADEYFADLDKDPGWTCAEESELMEENGIKYRFRTYKKR